MAQAISKMHMNFKDILSLTYAQLSMLLDGAYYDFSKETEKENYATTIEELDAIFGGM